jgi:hypothetical protein
MICRKLGLNLKPFTAKFLDKSEVEFQKFLKAKKHTSNAIKQLTAEKNETSSCLFTMNILLLPYQLKQLKMSRTHRDT